MFVPCVYGRRWYAHVIVSVLSGCQWLYKHLHSLTYPLPYAAHTSSRLWPVHVASYLELYGYSFRGAIPFQIIVNFPLA